MHLILLDLLSIHDSIIPLTDGRRQKEVQKSSTPEVWNSEAEEIFILFTFRKIDRRDSLHLVSN